MKHKLISTFVILTAAPATMASPYIVRQLPAGFDAAGPAGARLAPMAADFLGNGRLQWYQGGNVISRFPESGTITLPAITDPRSPAATMVPLAAAVCDVDGDGDQDIVRINEWNGDAFEYTLQVFRNNGAGGFNLGSRVDWTNSFPGYDEGRHQLQIVPGDFDRDGRIDLAVSEAYSWRNTTTEPNRYDGRIYIRWNDGQGGFSATGAVEASGIEQGSSLSVADTDRDGDLDIFTWRHTTFSQGGDRTSRSRLYQNNGGRSAMSTYIFATEMPLVLRDINGDGWADLADSNDRALNDGSGVFGAPVLHRPGVGNIVWDDLADLNDDGNVWGLFDTGNQLWAHRTMSFTTVPSTLLATLPAAIDGKGAADSDGDGDTDLFVSMQNGTFAFLENTRIHTIPGAAIAGSVAISGAGRMCSADFNLDGRDDVVTTGGLGMWITPALANGLPGTPVYKPTQSEVPAALVAEDFDTDGRPDVAYALATASAVRIARNNGGTLPTWPDTAIVTDLTGVSLLATGSVVAPNGRPDLFTVVKDSFIAPPVIRGYRQSTAGLWSPLDYVFVTGSAPDAIAVANHNGAPGDEVAVLGGDNTSLTVSGAQILIGGTSLGSDHTESITGGTAPARRLVWADTTGDSRKEVVFINGSGGLSSWDPTGETKALLSHSASAIRDIAAADWNRDGRTDILAATAEGLALCRFNRLNSQWVSTPLIAAAGGYQFVTIMDQNGDGYPDAAATSATGRLDWIRNTPCGMAVSSTVAPGPVAVAPDSEASILTLPLETGAFSAGSGASADADAVLENCQLYFQQAVSTPGGTWTPGAPLSGAALSSVVDSVSIGASGANLMSGAPSSSSSYILLNAQPGSPVVPVAPRTVVNHFVRLRMTAAAPPPVTRFFVTVTRAGCRQSDNSSELPVKLPNNLSVLVTIQSSAATPLQQWRQTHFGSPAATGIAANDADPDNDGVPNLVEYFTGSNPRATERALNAALGLSMLTPPNAQTPINLRLFGTTTALADPSVRVTIQSSSASLSSWTTFAARTGGGSWTGAAPQVLPPVEGRSNLFFTTTIKPETTRKFFVRLKVEELP